MLTREFLGWDGPFCGRVADWLLARGGELPSLLVLVPTAHSGHRLLEALVARAGTLLAPRIITPGTLMDRAGEEAPRWMEQAAWADALEEIEDWSRYAALFPEPPSGGPGWAGALGGELAGLRRSLQENGHTLETAARRLAGTIEAERWLALARLEQLVERRLSSAGAVSRSRLLARGLPLPECARIVVAGVTEMPGVLSRALTGTDTPVTVLIAAPEEEAEAFSPTGAPLACWTERPLPWPDGDTGAVHLGADPRHQADLARARVETLGTPPGDLALGSADEECSSELVRSFARIGMLLHRPGASPPVSGPHRWLRMWTAWLGAPKLSVLSDLLALPETSRFPGAADRARTAITLLRLRDEWMAIHPDDLRNRLDSGAVRTRADFAAARDVLTLAADLERRRREFERGDFVRAMGSLLDVLAPFDEETGYFAEVFRGWLAAAEPWIAGSRQTSAFWLELMLAEHPPDPLPPPDERDADVLGWLELLYESAGHLVLCGMNEGKVPPRTPAGAWMGETAVTLLGLRTREDRWARDAYLYRSLFAARGGGGRIDLLCGKSGAGGDALQPSRLLLAGTRDELPARVVHLFRGVEPPDAGLRWEADWKWKPRHVDPPSRLSATSFGDYLQCPFRFYLKHCLGMRATEPDRIEWNARDFGTLAHDLLEHWGRDEEARDFSKTEAIHGWLVERLDQAVAGSYGRDIPLAVRIQKAALAQRLEWFSREQACSRAEGWEVIDVEHKFSIPFGAHEVIAKIDRIDRHRETGELRVIDYKTGSPKGAAEAHRARITASTREVAHLPDDCPAFYETDGGKGKTVRYRWRNLQLPLYTVAVRTSHRQIALPCYFNLGASEPGVGILPWTGYDETDLAAAEACAGWIVSRITDRVFWPPAEKPPFDDFTVLSMGRPLADLVDPEHVLPVR